MSIYTAPHRATSKRSLSRHTRIILTTNLLTSAILLTIATLPASAAAKFVTIQDVQNAINAALAPIQSAIASLQQQQANQATQLTNQQSALTDLQNTQATHTTQIGDLQTQQTNQAQQISSLQNSTGKSPLLYDANGNLLGLSVNEGTYDFYDASLKRTVSISSNGGVTSQVGPSFNSSDCTGTSYAVNYVTNLMLYRGATLTPKQYVYYIVRDSDTQPTLQTIHSQIEGNNVCVTDGADGLPETLDVWQLTPVSINFTDPVPMPIHY